MLRLSRNPRTGTGIGFMLILALVGINFLVYIYGTSVQNINTYNSLLITVFTLIGIGLLADILKSSHVNFDKKWSFLVFLVPPLLMMTLVLRDTHLDFIGIWHTHYAIRAAESVVLRGNMSEFTSIFENFVSSFASPLFLAIISIVTNLEVITCFSFFGIIVFATVLTPMIYIICRLAGARDTETLHAAFLLSLGGVTFAPQFFVYSYIGLPLLVLALYYYVRVVIGRKTQTGYPSIIAFILITLGSLMYYLPGALLFVAVFLTLAIIATFLSKLRPSKSTPSHMRLAMLFFVVVVAYFAYCGFSFYDDIHTYLTIISKFFSLEPFIIYTPERLKLLDSVTSFVIQVTRLRNLIIFVYLFGLLQVIRSSEESALAKALSILGISLALLAHGGIFIHAITDYTYRFSLYLIPFGTFTLYFGMQLLHTPNRKLRLLAMTFLSLVFISNMFVFVHYLMVPASPPWASDRRYYIVEAFTTSAFVASYLDMNPLKTVVTNYRYGYISSVWGVGVAEISDWSLERFMEADNMILVLSLLNFKAPDRHIRRLTSLDYYLISTKTNLLYNSNITYIFFSVR